jgi:hypothetical protein
VMPSAAWVIQRLAKRETDRPTTRKTTPDADQSETPNRRVASGTGQTCFTCVADRLKCPSQVTRLDPLLENRPSNDAAYSHVNKMARHSQRSP